MPNINENYIFISGPKEDLDLFREARLRYDKDAIWLDEGALTLDFPPSLRYD